MNKEKLVLIGNGMAGMNAVEHLLKLAPDKYDIIVFGDEPHPNYNRILLSYVLAGESEIRDIVIHPLEWYESKGIKLHAGDKVTAVDTTRRTVSSERGVTVHYDKLVIATGSKPFMLPVPGAEKEGVMAYRTIRDCERMIEASKTYRKAVVIGGGLLGLEAARGFLNLGMQVDVVHLSDTIMDRQLDRTASHLLQEALERQGMNFLLGKQTAEITGESRVTGLRFQDGTSAEADLVVMAVGIRPNSGLALEAGIACSPGIVVDDYMQTSDPHVFAVGECAMHRGIVYGLVAPLYEQGAVLAKRLAGVDTAPYEGSVVYTKLKVSGVDVFSGGSFQDSPGTKAIRIQDDFSGVYKKVVMKDNRIVGAVLFGDTADGTRLMQMIREGTDISRMEKTAILQDPSTGTATGSGTASMSDDAIICGCNGVTKGVICSAIRDQGLTSVEEVKNCTTASRSCGGCKPLVADLLALTLGDAFDRTKARETMCGCTGHTRDEIVAAIREKRLTHVREVMNVLGWKNEEGCSKCRPALNYYLGMIFPDVYEDNKASRFVNERMHANIQKDGTYSVVPRIYGGVTTPSDLKRIAEVAEKFNVPTVKLTGGQRIDLLGVRKEDLTAMWEELDMPSGYAYGKALRTVKTCVGETYCRFGTGDAMAVGIALEKRFERLNTPAKVKLAVSGCPRNCAESGIKDLGVVSVDGGWELYAGGNGGVKVRVGDLLTTVKTEAEIMAYTEAYLQYYRETGNYGERTSEWVNRLGIDHIRRVVEDSEQRRELGGRMAAALAVTKDPWQEAIRSESIRKDLYEVVELK
ncbi:nitrite reductase (NADH) large subunit [Paenibacillus sp. UNCCL117]|uniref:nitrite reductase large subunit NirB n=1 Tax=unclassified Paenibacillus TaxID=185978 RepID=UPI00088321CD|nr:MULTISPECIES: nitrite reductase large subunit NirB [unclassified Paenibacillus]SDD23897.1 assimilatory nitrite reductase (NAD(P)H) large subunit precursor [Paenibacillus sp. cl123]SFW41592.1 nitrite reductase (NADH) large subunit [Paenibacillus sp. UNCCL117]